MSYECLCPIHDHDHPPVSITDEMRQRGGRALFLRPHGQTAWEDLDEEDQKFWSDRAGVVLEAALGVEEVDSE